MLDILSQPQQTLYLYQTALFLWRCLTGFNHSKVSSCSPWWSSCSEILLLTVQDQNMEYRNCVMHLLSKHFRFALLFSEGCIYPFTVVGMSPPKFIGQKHNPPCSNVRRWDLIRGEQVMRTLSGNGLVSDCICYKSEFGLYADFCPILPFYLLP